MTFTESYKDVSTIRINFKDKKITLVPQDILRYDGATEGARTSFLADYAMLITLDSFLAGKEIEQSGLVKVKKAEIETATRQKAAASGEKFTDAGIKASAESDPKLLTAMSELDETQALRRVVGALFMAAHVKYQALTTSLYSQSK